MTAPASADDLGAFILEGQADLLLAALDKQPDKAAAQRKAVGNRLANWFYQLTVSLQPDLVIEVGAHAADYSKASKQALPGSRVVAFEAHPEVHAKFAGEAAAAGVEFMPLCVADRDGMATFKVPMKATPTALKERRLTGSLLTDVDADRVSQYEVRSVRLDDYLGNAARLSNTLWIDVEGAIGPVLDGADVTLKHCLALLVEVESSPRWMGQITDREVAGRLASYGLTPVLRDIQRNRGGAEWQYNVAYIRSDLLRQGRSGSAGALSPRRQRDDDKAHYQYDPQRGGEAKTVGDEAE
jgi:FkbM family methyltransferase